MRGTTEQGPGIVRLVLPASDCIVEERLWIRGSELVSHVNYSLLGRVRASLGLSGEASSGPVDWMSGVQEWRQWGVPMARSA